MDIEPSKNQNDISKHQNSNDFLTKKVIFSRVEITGIVLLSVLSIFVTPLMYGAGPIPKWNFLSPFIWVGTMSFAWILVLYVTRMLGWKKSFWIGLLPGIWFAAALTSGFFT
jgi:hypothetical protein